MVNKHLFAGLVTIELCSELDQLVVRTKGNELAAFYTTSHSNDAIRQVQLRLYRLTAQVKQLYRTIFLERQK